MNLVEYKKIINETAVFPRKVENFGLAYCLLGLFDELQEVEEKIDNRNSKEEIFSEVGDVIWYICALCNELNISFEDVIINNKKVEKEYTPLKLFGIVKKYYRDNKSIDKNFVYNVLLNVTNYLFTSANVTVNDVNNIIENNYKKLIARRETNTLHGDGDNREKINT